MNSHSSGRNILLYLFIKWAEKLTVVIIDGYHYYQLHTKCYPIFLQVNSIDKITGEHQCGFQCNRSTIDQVFCDHQILEKKWEYEYIGTVHQEFIDFKTACDSVRRERLYNILTEISTFMKIVRLIKMCVNETCSKVCIDKNLSAFPIQNGLK